MMTLFAPVHRTALTRVCIPATSYGIPTQSRPPCSQHCQPADWLLWLAWSGYGSLNRAKMTALLPLNAFGTDFPNRTSPAPSGMGFWHIALSHAHADAPPLYCPSVQC